jgi:translation initiation factor 2B subunit (eIF-2B alpha/beta/delta family)
MRTRAKESGAPRQPTEVVTAFVWDGRRVLLALRSEQVSTYPAYWAGISGYLEGNDPLAWSLVEIEEECRLPRRHLTLRASGTPLEVRDEALGLEFRVHPFLWHVADPSLVRADWEAARFEWVEVDELLQRRRQPTVPMLPEAFEQVWPPWPVERAIEANAAASLEWLRRDRQMGAGQLARSAAAEVLKLARLLPDPARDEDRAAVQRAAGQLQAARPGMATLFNLLDDVQEDLRQAPTPHHCRHSIERRILDSEAAEAEAVRRAAQRISAGQRVMTLSFSGTVQRVLTAAAGRIARVVVCEGRPLCEGRQLAAGLGEAGIAVTLATDAQADLLMPQVDLVLLGADAITTSGDAVNKVGSTLLALSAQRHQKPVLVVAESLKWIRPDRPAPLALESDPAEEVWAAPPGIAVANFYFETVPHELIAQIVSDGAACP